LLGAGVCLLIFGNALHWHQLSTSIGAALLLTITAFIPPINAATDAGPNSSEALLKLEQRFRSVVESLGEGFVITDLDGAILFANTRMAELSGYGLEEMLGKSCRELLVPPSLYSEHQSRLRERSRGVAEHYETQIQRRDGGSSWVEVNSTPFRDHSGRIVGVLDAVTDITARKWAEEALRASERRYRLLFERNLAGVYRITRDRKVLDCNDACARLFGYVCREELLAYGTWDFHPNPDSWQSMLDQLNEHAKLTNLETPLRRKDGSTVWVLENATLTESENGYGPIIEGSLFEITERKSLEDQLRQAQKMEAVGRLAGGVAHDFNNLLTVITGYARLLLDRLDRESPMRSSLNEIKKAADRAGALTSQLLAFSRHQAVEPQVLDLNDVVRNVEGMLCRLIGEDLQLVTRLTPGEAQIEADQSQIEQVIFNLIVNARDAMPEGGGVTIATERVELDAAQARQQNVPKAGSYVTLSITDTGCGMTPETQAHIFEPFFTTKEVGKGTGLGLATVYGIVSRGRGYIRVNSAPDKGSTFCLYFPRVEASTEVSDAATVSTALPNGAETILLVEDEVLVRSMLRDILTANGYKVLEADHGGNALSAVVRHNGPVDLVVTDVVMPHMGGKELVEQLTSIYPNLKVVYISGYTDRAIIRQGSLDSGTRFLQKPFTPDVLAHTVRKVLDA
jgi:PAS domain S-box-containing protein